MCSYEYRWESNKCLNLFSFFPEFCEVSISCNDAIYLKIIYSNPENQLVIILQVPYWRSEQAFLPFAVLFSILYSNSQRERNVA
jgi:hypothetical protein